MTMTTPPFRMSWRSHLLCLATYTAAFFLIFLPQTEAFYVAQNRLVTSPSSSPSSSTTALFDGDGTGGWGIGGSRELTPEEFARSDRGYFDGYKMSDQGDFVKTINAEKEAFKKNDLEELLGVARIAGLNVKNPKERLNKFEDGILEDEEEDDLDLSV